MTPYRFWLLAGKKPPASPKERETIAYLNLGYKPRPIVAIRLARRNGHDAVGGLGFAARPEAAAGPGKTRKEVEQNQRERIYGAMIALVAEKGYEATTLVDLAELSGVSSRTFYGLFENKRACFAETLQNVIMLAVGIATQIGSDPSSADGRSSREPARTPSPRWWPPSPPPPGACLIEAYAAGPEVVAPLEGAIAGFEMLAKTIIAQSPERAAMPDEMLAAYIGGLEEIVRMRLLSGEEDALPDLIDQLWDLIGSYVPPPEPLRLAERVPVTAAESLDAHDNAERAIRAFAVEAAERGYAATTVADILARAQMSATTFYDQFGGKEDAMLAAIDSAGARIAAAMRPQCGGPPTGRRRSERRSEACSTSWPPGLHSLVWFSSTPMWPGRRP